MNPDHLKYMPHAPEEETPEEEIIIEIKEETAPSPAPSAPAAADASEADKGSEPEHEGKGKILTWLFAKGTLQFLYDIFNPFLIPAYATLLIFELSVLALVAPGTAAIYTLGVLGATCIFPLLVILILKAIGAVSAISLPLRKDRRLPYAAMFVALGAVILFTAYRGAPQWMLDVYLGASATVLINFIINFFIKVSNHCSALAATPGIFLAIQQDSLPHYGLEWWMIGSVLLAGVIGTCAILIGRHNLKEVFVGYITGFLPVILFSLIR